MLIYQCFLKFLSSPLIYMCLDFTKFFSQQFTLDTNSVFHSNQLSLITYAVFFQAQSPVPLFSLISFGVPQTCCAMMLCDHSIINYHQVRETKLQFLRWEWRGLQIYFENLLGREEQGEGRMKLLNFFPMMI